MADPVLLSADGSDLSTAALAAGLAVVRSDLERVVVTVAEPPDTTLVTGTGFAGGTMSSEEFDRMVRDTRAAAQSTAERVAAALGLGDADVRVIEGAVGPSICELASELGAAAIVIGSRGHGGLKRAVLGSVSDHVVRNATCPVVVTSPS